MIIRKKVIFPILIMIAEIVITINPANAHRFNVALVIPLSDTALVQGRQIRNGFMLATTERDSHPDQESDGHLGGLDVYVTVIDGQGNVAADINRIVAQNKVSIVAAFGPDTTLSPIKKHLDGEKIVLLLPSQSPFSKSDSHGVVAFISAYEREYGNRPSSQAAQGYHAARRIDHAVRAQGGVDDMGSLLRIFKETAHGFTW